MKELIGDTIDAPSPSLLAVEDPCSNDIPSEKQVLEALNADLQAHIFLFLTTAELWLLHHAFPDAVGKTLSHQSMLHFSFLDQVLPVRIIANTENNSHNNNDAVSTHNNIGQEEAVEKLLSLRIGNDQQEQQQQATRNDNHNLKRLECDSLRGVTGRTWLMKLPSSLKALDLAGCTRLNPDSLIDFLQQSTCQLISLNLAGCVKLSNSVVTAIAHHQPQLQELWLGGCSQSIANRPIHLLLQKLTRLTHLDLQTLNNISDLSGQFVSSLPLSLKSLNLTSCRQLRLASLEALEGIQYHMNHLGRDNLEHWKSAPISRHCNIMHLVLDAIGTPRVGLCRGIVTYFAMGRNLREVHLTGCEHVQDWEIEALAVTCASTLTCFQMRAGRIGDPAVVALARYCQSLAEIDLAACFRVTDLGVIALAEAHSGSMLLSIASESGDDNDVAAQPESKRIRREETSRLRVLRLASLPGLTNAGIHSIGKINSLHVLDVQDCIEVSSGSLVEISLKLPHLIEVNATNIRAEQSTYLAQMRAMSSWHPNFPIGLHFINGRVQSWGSPKLDDIPKGCCLVREQAQRLDCGSIPKAVMYHCVDCNLMPTVDRGICVSCVSRCHRGHETFVASWNRFYCDCPFGCAGNDQCKAVFPAPKVVAPRVTLSIRA